MTGKVECIPALETKALALAVRSAGGHFGRDMSVLALQQQFFWPTLRRNATETITTCPCCKNFGPCLLLAQMQPITHARPFDLLVGDYLSLPLGHGGFKTVLILVDAYSCFVFAFPIRGAGTGKTTVDSLSRVADVLLTPRSFMADSGSHFDCDEARNWAAGQGVQVIKTPPYAPWTNGLAEGYVKLLIGCLKCLCTATVGESSEEDANATTTPASWPKHLATAVVQLNNHALLSLNYSPRKLMTGQLAPERKAELSTILRAPTLQEVEINLVLTYSLRQDAYASALEHATRCKRVFDKKVHTAHFQPGDLVQRCDAHWDKMHSATRKPVPCWSGPLWITSHALNSYLLEDLHGKQFLLTTHSCLLRPFTPRQGSSLATYADSLAASRVADPSAHVPASSVPLTSLLSTPRPEHRFLLECSDETQSKNNYQDNDDIT